MLSIVFTSCNKNEDNGTSNPIDDGYNETQLDLGSTIQRDFMGRIVDVTNLPIENVIVTIGIKTAVTDANGMFIINNADVQEKQAYIIAEKGGYLSTCY